MKLTIEHEIERARAAGVSHPENLPYLLAPDHPNQHGVLLVHGFGSTPREMRALADYLFERNFTVLGIRLPGHGTSPEDLAKRRAEEWLTAVERGYQILQHKSLKISAVGLSTGSLLLLQLCRLRPVERLVLLSPYLRLKHPLSPFSNILSFFIPFYHRQIEASERPFYYQRRPLSAIGQLNRLRSQVKNILYDIKTPTLVITSTGDQTIYPGTAEQLFNQLGSKDKNFHCYGDEVPHVLTTEENPCQADVFQRTTAFLEVLTPQTTDSPTQQD